MIEGLSFTLTGPERVAITGTNGSGKTTLLALLTERLAPWEGRVRVVPEHAMLDQTISLLDPALSIRDNFRRLHPHADENECRAALARYATLTPVLDDEEGQTVTVERGTDPASVKVTGNVTGEPPYRGVLRHRGWQVARLELPPLPASGRTIIAPAEVEVS